MKKLIIIHRIYLDIDKKDFIKIIIIELIRNLFYKMSKDEYINSI